MVSQLFFEIFCHLRNGECIHAVGMASEGHVFDHKASIGVFPVLSPIPRRVPFTAEHP